MGQKRILVVGGVLIAVAVGAPATAMLIPAGVLFEPRTAVVAPPDPAPAAPPTRATPHSEGSVRLRVEATPPRKPVTHPRPADPTPALDGTGEDVIPPPPLMDRPDPADR